MTLPALNSFSLFISRLHAMALRHYYLYLGSWPRLVEMFYWPIINLILYGLISLSIANHLGQNDLLTSAFLAGLLLTEILTRTILSILIMYMEEMHSRNMGHLFASPLRLWDFVGSLLLLGITRCTVTVIPLSLL